MSKEFETNDDLVRKIKMIADFTDSKDISDMFFKEVLNIILHDLRKKSIELQQDSNFKFFKEIKSKDDITSENFTIATVLAATLADIVLSYFTHKLTKDIGVESFVKGIKEKYK